MTMSGISERYTNVAGQFTQRARSVPDGAWDNPAPCEGWVARDVVRHMVEAGAWEVVSDAIRAALDEPEIAAREFDMRAGRYTVEQAVATFCVGDVLVHTWDLARATGLDEALDADEVHRMLEGIEPTDELLRQSGHYGARVEVPDDADEQTRLIAFTGRRP